MESNVDAFAEMSTPTKGANLAKQDRFGASTVWKLLQAFESYPGGAYEELKRIGEDKRELTAFTLSSLAFPMHIVTIKIGKPLSSMALLKGLMRTSLRTHIEEISDEVDGDPFGIVFDSEGSGFQELIIHNVDDVKACMSDWYVTYPMEDIQLYLSTYKAFLAAAKIAYSGWRVPQV